MAKDPKMERGCAYGFTDTMFEMPGDYGIDNSEDMPSVDCGLAHLPDHVRPAMYRLHAKETVLRTIMKSPARWTGLIAKLTMEVGSLRSAISYEYLNSYDRKKNFTLKI